MRRVGSIATALAITAIGGTGIALAHSDSATDPRGDVAGNPPGAHANFDIVGSTIGDASHGKVTQTVKVAGALGDPNHGGLVPLLYINVPSYPGATRECDFFVGRVRSHDGVYTCATVKRVGPATIVRKGGNTLRYMFSPKAIGRPPSYEWAFVTEGRADGTIETFDRIPDGQTSMYTYKLR